MAQKVELPYFSVEGAYGGNQDWLREPFMRLGGCAALTACDACIALALHGGMPQLYPHARCRLSRKDYISFASKMKPYLRPRAHGVDKLCLFVDGFSQYLQAVGGTGLSMTEFAGNEPYEAAEQAVVRQLDAGLPVPFLLLRHTAPELDDFTWHWFLLVGYEKTNEGFFVKAATYGKAHRLPFATLWDTGHARRGGMVLLQKAPAAQQAAG